MLIHQLLKWQNYYIRFAYSTFLIFLISVGFYTSLYFLWDSFTYMVCKYIYTLFAIEIGTNVLYINRSCFSMLKMVMIILSLHLCQFLYLNLLFYCHFISCLYGFILNKYLNQWSLMWSWMEVGLWRHSWFDDANKWKERGSGY